MRHVLVVCAGIAALGFSATSRAGIYGSGLSPRVRSGNFATRKPTVANEIWGTIVDTDRRPLPNAQIRVEGVSDTGGRVFYSARSDVNGKYGLRVATGRYSVSAWAQRVFEGSNWILRLHPTDNSDEEFDPAAGVNKNFQWRLSGSMPGSWPDNDSFYYGAAVRVKSSIGIFDDHPGVVTFTFIPNARLIDGSIGRPIVFKRTFEQLNNEKGLLGATSILYDIPIGTYSVTALANFADGRVGEIYIRSGFIGGYQTTAIIKFKPSSTIPYGPWSNHAESEPLYLRVCWDLGQRDCGV